MKEKWGLLVYWVWSFSLGRQIFWFAQCKLSNLRMCRPYTEWDCCELTTTEGRKGKGPRQGDPSGVRVLVLLIC